MASEGDFEVVDGLAEQRERSGVGWFDNARIRVTPETERLGFAGQVLGETIPSEGAIEGETVAGKPEEDFALYMDFGEERGGAWVAPQLVEFIDRAAGTVLEVGSEKMIRAEHGGWCDVKRRGLLRRFLARLH